MKRVEVAWRDSTRYDLGWGPVKDYAKLATPYLCYTTGYLAHQNARYVLVALSSGPDDTVNQAIAIPRGCIVKVRRL